MKVMSLKHIGNVDDYDMADALNAFIRNAGVDDVTVDFELGVASLRGSVESITASRAVEDLIMAHEGVENVVNNLEVGATDRSPEPADVVVEPRRPG